MKYSLHGNYYDTQELAQLVNVPWPCVSRDLRSGEIEVLRIGMVVLVEEKEAERYITEKKRGRFFYPKKLNPEGMLSVSDMVRRIERSRTWLESRMRDNELPHITAENGRKFVAKEDFDSLLKKGFGKKIKK